MPTLLKYCRIKLIVKKYCMNNYLKRANSFKVKNIRVTYQNMQILKRRTFVGIVD